MSKERFIALVEENGGFEFVRGFCGDEDRFMGGKGDTFWYIVMKKGKAVETLIGKRAGNVWKDIRVKGSGKNKKTEDAAPGATIARIAKEAYLAQDEDWVAKRKPRLIEDAHPHYHYVYGFGDKAADVSERFGVTIAYSDIRDVASGFHLRDLSTGKDVTLPD